MKVKKNAIQVMILYLQSNMDQVGPNYFRQSKAKNGPSKRNCGAKPCKFFVDHGRPNLGGSGGAEPPKPKLFCKVEKEPRAALALALAFLFHFCFRCGDSVVFIYCHLNMKWFSLGGGAWKPFPPRLYPVETVSTR